MTFGEYKASGGTYDYIVWANDPKGGFGRKGSPVYGYTPAMENWEVYTSTGVSGVVDGKPVYRTTLHVVYPHK